MNVSCFFAKYTQRIWLIFVSFLILSVQSSLGAHDVTLMFKDSVIVNDSLIRLVDIASVTCEDKSKLKILEAHIAGKSAPPGYSRFVNTIDLIMYSIKPLIPETKIISPGNKRISVHTASVQCTVARMYDTIAEYLDSVITWKKGDWSFEVVNGEQVWNGYKGPYNCSVSGLTTGKAKGKVILNLQFLQGTKVTKVPVIIALTVKASVLVARHDIERTTILSSSDVETQTADITHFAPEPFTDLKELEGTVTTMTIKAGAIIQNRMVRKLPDVSQGDNVVIIYNKGRVTCSIMGTARETGVIGDKILVENTVSRQFLRVVIVGKGRVELV